MNITELQADKARAYLLKSLCYFDVPLPLYYEFGGMLQKISKYLIANPTCDVLKNLSDKPSSKDLNHTIVMNKDGKYAWRPKTLVNPILYTVLAHTITEEVNWEKIVLRFRQFANCQIVKCCSVPRYEGGKRPAAVAIRNWLNDVEGESIRLSLRFNYLHHTDIADCYPSIYSHSISWAIEAIAIRGTEKENDKTLLGNRVDYIVRTIMDRKSNGIPQGSVLFDTIAELILGYLDQLIEDRLMSSNITHNSCRILRYRDDNRIFTVDISVGEHVLRVLTEVLLSFGLKLNSAKTLASDNVVACSVKPDKIAYYKMNLKLHDLFIMSLVLHDFALRWPNSKQTIKGLRQLHQRIKTSSVSVTSKLKPILAIVIDIAKSSPIVYQEAFLVVSLINSMLPKIEFSSAISDIEKSCDRYPHNHHMMIWLKRVVLDVSTSTLFSDIPLCNAIADKSLMIWESSFVGKKHAQLSSLLKPHNYINHDVYKQCTTQIGIVEVNIFDALHSL